MGNSPTDSKKNSPPSVSQLDSTEAPVATSIAKPDISANEEKRHSIAPLAPPHLAYEPNPFEHSFATGASAETSSNTKLPSVATLASPAPLLPGGGTTPYNWTGSLRTGPLSPAMLSGPANDYFGDSHLRGGFPTPNESSLRTGLTPGGGGSMFPAPSPNSQALFNSMASGGATPSTLDFHRTALSAAAAVKRPDTQLQSNITSQPQDVLNGMDKGLQNQSSSEVFGQHDANDAANGLFMLASQSRTGSQGGQYALAQQQPVHAHPQASSAMVGVQSIDTSPALANRQSGSLSTASGRGMSEASEESEQKNRPNTRGRGKKAAAAQANGRRKNEDSQTKTPASKKSKGNNGNAMAMMELEPPSEEEPEMSREDEYNANGKKMTDEEKRKNFLERNRVAALKCRQRKKQWLANLQQKVELYSSENDALGVQISALREEVVNLKTLLLAHKDCPVSQQQGLGNMHIQLMGEYAGQIQNPYGMAMNGQQIMAGQGISRRYS